MSKLLRILIACCAFAVLSFVPFSYDSGSAGLSSALADGEKKPPTPHPTATQRPKPTPMPTCIPQKSQKRPCPCNQNVGNNNCQGP